MQAGNQGATFWNGVARKYAASPVKDVPSYERSLAATMALLTPASRVYEIGCGTGSTALRLAGSAGDIVATDISAEMIHIARARAEAAGAGNIDFQVAAATDAAAPQGFDVALCFNTLYLVADRRAVLHRLRAALKPGGHFVSKTLCLRGAPLAVRLLAPLMAALGQAPKVHLFSQDELVAEISAAGFDILRIENHDTKAQGPRPFIVARRRDDA